MIENIDLGILAPALGAGLLVLASHVPLGQEVLKRGIIFIDLAIAQMVGLGVILAMRLGFEAHGWQIQFIAMLAALLGAWGLSLLEKHHAQMQEALIGISFVLAATGSILLLADDPHSGEQLKELLVGQILWITWAQLLPSAVITALILALWFKFKTWRPTSFYFLFALAVTNSVQLVGVYLVFASLIMPTLSSHDCAPNKAGLFAYIIGALGYLIGLLLSALLDLPSGAMIVWSIAIVALFSRSWLKKSAS